jgi:hypothetical protein
MVNELVAHMCIVSKTNWNKFVQYINAVKLFENPLLSLIETVIFPFNLICDTEWVGLDGKNSVLCLGYVS